MQKQVRAIQRDFIFRKELQTLEGEP